MLVTVLRKTCNVVVNIFVQFGGRLFCQMIGIPMGTNCAALLADLFLYSYENEFLHNMIISGHRRLTRSFNLCYRYIDYLIVFNNKKFLDYLKEIYPSQLLTPPQSCCSYSILHLKLFNIFTKNIAKHSSETAKLHQENGCQYGYRHIKAQKYFQSWVSNHCS